MLVFLASRRRHTILTCDWSSDVCSSDLAAGSASIPARTRRANGPQSARTSRGSRSEERRVGKECRSRGAPYQQNKKPLEAGTDATQKPLHRSSLSEGTSPSASQPLAPEC